MRIKVHNNNQTADAAGSIWLQSGDSLTEQLLFLETSVLHIKKHILKTSFSKQLLQVKMIQVLATINKTDLTHK